MMSTTRAPNVQTSHRYTSIIRYTHSLYCNRVKLARSNEGTRVPMAQVKFFILITNSLRWNNDIQLQAAVYFISRRAWHFCQLDLINKCKKKHYCSFKNNYLHTIYRSTYKHSTFSSCISYNILNRI